MEYEQFITNNTLNQEREIFKESIKTLTLDYSKTDFQKYERLNENFQQFCHKVRSKVYIMKYLGRETKAPH